MFLYSYANSAGILSYLCYVSIGMVLRYIFGIIASREKDSALLKLNGLMCLNELKIIGSYLFPLLFTKIIIMKNIHLH